MPSVLLVIRGALKKDLNPGAETVQLDVRRLRNAVTARR
jgi:hypothetical protein